MSQNISKNNNLVTLITKINNNFVQQNKILLIYKYC